MIRKIIIFGFPFFLVLLEAFLRKALNVDSYAFLGPTLAAVGIGFVIPLTRLKDIAEDLEDDVQQYLKGEDILAYSKSEVWFFGVICIMLILMVSGWYCSLYYSLESPDKYLCRIPIALGLGVLIYVVGSILSIIKGKI